MKSFKKITAIVLAFILTFSVLTVVSLAADADTVSAEIPTYSGEDLTYTPTMDIEPTKDLGDLGDNIKDLVGDDALGDISDGVHKGVAAGFDFMDFFRRVMRTLIELFEHVNIILSPAK